MKIKWGIIGAGGIADRRAIPGIMLTDNAEIEAVMEVNMTLADKIRSKYNISKAYDTIEALLDESHIDAVYIASPVAFHRDQALLAVKAGKHLLIEKPLGLTAEQGEEIAAACTREGVMAAVGFMMRFHAYHSIMRDMIATGRIGRVVSSRAQLTCWYPDMPGNWRQQWKTSGGGALMDMGIHCIDLIQYITGSRVRSLSAFTGTKTFHYEVEDSASLTMEMEDGSYSQVDAYFNIPDGASKCRLEIYGTRGSMLAEGTIGQEERGTLEVFVSEENKEYDSGQEAPKVSSNQIQTAFGNMYAKEFASFSRSILTGSPIEVPIEEGIYAQRIVEKAYKSAKDGKRLSVEL